MRTIFNQIDRREIISRIQLLNEHSRNQWGRMNVYQMVKHNVIWSEWILGKDGHSTKQTIMGKLFGRKSLQRMIRDFKPLPKYVPTSSRFKIREKEGSLDDVKQQWRDLVLELEDFDNDKFLHDFFGVMTKGEVGILAYKHFDHHLRQFGA